MKKIIFLIAVTITALLNVKGANPNFISTVSNVPCYDGSSHYFSVSSVLTDGTTASNFEWTTPQGTYMAGSSTNISFPLGGTQSFTVKVRAFLDSLYSGYTSVTVTRNINTSDIASISGVTNPVCKQATGYSVPNLYGASYTWGGVSSWISGSGNSVTVTPEGSSGVLTVSVAACGQNFPTRSKNLYPKAFADGTSISGSGPVCSSSREFSVNGLPSGSYVYWSYDSKLNGVYGGNTWVALVGTGNGDAVINASVANVCTTSPVSVPYTTVWVGAPQFTIDGTEGLIPYETFGIATMMTSSTASQGFTGKYWSYDGGPLIFSGIDNSVICRYRATSSSVNGHIYLQATNACGSYSSSLSYIIINDDPSALLDIRNNNEEIIISKSAKIRNTENSSQYTVEIWDLNYNKKIGLKDYQFDSSINISNLKQGMYIMKIINGDQVYTEKFMKK